MSPVQPICWFWVFVPFSFVCLGATMHRTPFCNTNKRKTRKRETKCIGTAAASPPTPPKIFQALVGVWEIPPASPLTLGNLYGNKLWSRYSGIALDSVNEAVFHVNATLGLLFFGEAKTHLVAPLRETWGSADLSSVPHSLIPTPVLSVPPQLHPHHCFAYLAPAHPH